MIFKRKKSYLSLFGFICLYFVKYSKSEYTNFNKDIDTLFTVSHKVSHKFHK